MQRQCSNLRTQHPELAQARDFLCHALAKGARRVVEVASGVLVGVGFVLPQPRHLAGVDRQGQAKPLRRGKDPAYGFDGYVDDTWPTSEGRGCRSYKLLVRQGCCAGQVVDLVYGFGAFHGFQHAPRAVSVVDGLPEVRAWTEHREDGPAVEEAEQAVDVLVPLGAVDHGRAHDRPRKSARAHDLLHLQLRTGTEGVDRVYARAPHDHEPFDAGPAGRPDDSRRMLYPRDVQESVYVTQRSVEVSLVRGVAAADLHPLPVEPRGVRAVRANEAADSVPFG